jgi:dTDP-4-amino-4,6-dideoxygalactose transaminase
MNSTSIPPFSEPLHVGRPNIGNREALMARIEGMLDRRWLSNNGPLVQEFEAKLAAFLGVEHVVAMCNATIALEIAARALGMKGEVIVPSYTFIATAHALQWQEIRPVFADIDPGTHNLDPVSVEARITPRTSGIVGVHLWGRPAPVEALEALAARRGLKLMYDASHAFGCSHRGKAIGGFGACEVFSFHATKFFNTFEGGCVATNDGDLAKKIRLMTNFGFAGYDNVIYPGTNGKMTEVCAAMGLTNLESLEEFRAVNRRNYEAYREGLGGCPWLKLLPFEEAERNNFQYVVVEVQEGSPVGRDALVERLHSNNILARKYFWPGCHRMMPYRETDPGAGGHLPQTEKVADRVIVLPTGTAVSAEVIFTICRFLLTPCS